MNLMVFVKKIGAFAMLAAAVAAPANAVATEFVYHFDTVYSGTSAAPVSWMEALFQDVAPGTVRLTLSSEGLAGDEFVSGLYFNLNPNLNVGGLNIVCAGGSSDVAPPLITKATDGSRAGGGVLFDLNFSFATANHGRFVGGRCLEYTLAGLSGLDASDFAFTGIGTAGHPPLYASAHIQAIGSANDSVWICPQRDPYVPVPEPSSLALAGLGVAALFWHRRRS